MKNNTWTIIGVVAVLLLVGSVIYSNQVANQANEGIAFEPHIKGNPEATAVLVEYSDFQCPACAQAFPVVQQLIEEHGDKVSFEYKHFPLTQIHPLAIPAARAAEAAGQQDKFFEMHDLIFENQSVWSNAANPQVFFDQYAAEIGLDMDLFKTHMNASVITDKIRGEFDEARSLGFTGTPTFTLNGQRMQFQNYEDFINQVLAATGAPAPETPAVSSPADDIEFGI